MKEGAGMIAQIPPMGWNSWDCYGAAVNEETVRRNAKYMAEHLKEFGCLSCDKRRDGRADFVAVYKNCRNKLRQKTARNLEWDCKPLYLCTRQSNIKFQKIQFKHLKIISYEENWFNSDDDDCNGGFNSQFRFLQQ